MYGGELSNDGGEGGFKVVAGTLQGSRLITHYRNCHRREAHVKAAELCGMLRALLARIKDQDKWRAQESHAPIRALVAIVRGFGGRARKQSRKSDGPQLLQELARLVWQRAHDDAPDQPASERDDGCDDDWLPQPSGEAGSRQFLASAAGRHELETMEKEARAAAEAPTEAGAGAGEATGWQAAQAAARETREAERAAWRAADRERRQAEREAEGERREVERRAKRRAAHNERALAASALHARAAAARDKAELWVRAAKRPRTQADAEGEAAAKRLANPQRQRRLADAEQGQAAAERPAAAPPLTSAEALRQAEAEGLTLAPAKSATGLFFGVLLRWPGTPRPYVARVWRGGKTVHLGGFATAEEAALCVARSPEGQAAAERRTHSRSCG